MRTRRFIKRCFAFAVSVVMVWVVTVIPSGTVKAQWLYKSFAAPSITEVGSYVYWQGHGLQPNRVYWVRMRKDNVDVGGDWCPDDTITTDAEGRWAKMVGPMTPADVGIWDIGILASSSCSENNTDIFHYRVTAAPFRLTVNNPTLDPGAGATFAISGGPPNQQILWSTYKDGNIIERGQFYGQYTDANGNFTASTTTAQLNWGAQSPALGHLIGRADADGWSASVGVDGEGWLQYGPYTTQVPAGNHTAVWNLMIDNNTADNENVVYLDVYDYTTNTVLASSEVPRKAWTATWKYQPFLLPFTSEAGHTLEFRVYWRGNAYVREQKVSVDPAWGLPQPGQYMKVAEINNGLGRGYQATTAYRVLAQPKFTYTLSSFHVPVNGYQTTQITGAPPNAPVKWTRYLNGSLWDQDIFIGNTDANGNFTFQNGPWLEVWSGLWTQKITIEGVSVEKHYVVNRMTTTIPPEVVYSYTPPTYDPGTGKYYSDAQAHTGGMSPGTGPMVDVSGRTWFYDAAATQVAGLDLLSFTSFDGEIRSGNMCSQDPLVPIKCMDCALFWGNKCLTDNKIDIEKALNDSGFYTLACLGALAIPPPVGEVIAIICLVYVLWRHNIDLKQAKSKLVDCICGLPGKCSDETQENCSALLSIVKPAKQMCQGLPYVPKQ